MLDRGRLHSTGTHDELLRAYTAGGADLFDEEDPKYLELLTADNPPPSGKRWKFWK